ncbi:MAG: beta-N-acetylhexosaminidase [Thiothrix sp.]|nr:beta-N-acetylhexosaminidase [Thiothrix sp.]HPE61061.1 beta-N-acetylhexosaminidase [Thiolinea sp.]
MAIGALMLDLEGVDLTPEEHELLQHPQVGGVIFFTRNYQSASQMTSLCQSVRQTAGKDRDILLAVDHEGGRVQRFRPEFTRLPPVARLGRQYDTDPEKACDAAFHAGWLMAAEVRAIGIDFSFAPVLDLDYGHSSVIGDRAFHHDPTSVIRLAGAYIRGMHHAGMAATGKHFPGHGWVSVDSHLGIPHDERNRTEIARDLMPFRELAQQGLLDAVMPAHVIYQQVDSQPAGFSPIWIRDILRAELGFEGVIFSDDLNMEGASFAGSYADRAETALAAGCDMALLCNNRAGAIEVLDRARLERPAASRQRLERMRGQPFMNRSALLAQEYWQQAATQVSQLA